MTKADVLLDSRTEFREPLEHAGHVAMVFRRAISADVDAIYEQFALVKIDDAEQYLRQR